MPDPWSRAVLTPTAVSQPPPVPDTHPELTKYLWKGRSEERKGRQENKIAVLKELSEEATERQ